MGVALWGYYGFNYGDDIMMETILNHLLNRNITVELVDHLNSGLEEKYGDRSEKLKVIPYYKYTRLQKFKALKKLSKESINIWGGGTVFTDVDGIGNHRIFSIIKLLGGRIGYIGIGIGQLTIKDRIRKTKHLLKVSDFTVFRDENSLKKANELVKRADYLLAEDMAYLYFSKLDYTNLTFNKEKEKYVLVTWRNLKNYMGKEKENELMNIIVEGIKNLKKYGMEQVILAALDTRHDNESCEILQRKLNEENIKVFIEQDSSINNITALIKNCAFHFSGRLHGSVASELMNIPTISLSYSPKMAYFYESINSINYFDVYDETFNLIQLNKLIDKNKNNEENKSHKMGEVFNQKFQEATLNLNYLDEYLDKIK
ncbi:polysaccharide pyruvyl transferase family protein [Niallia circulans]|uniref:polysaccharide pyruvyl transferase family protein n=1 Tax=Niallia circulans TaxID=1397 RepID=UPI003D99DA7E